MALIHIASQTASGDPATISFTTGIDDTYNEYQFHFVNMHPATDGDFQFQVNASDDTGGGFDTSLITSSHFRTWHRESDDTTFFGYFTGGDLAQQALYQIMSNGVENEDDNGCSGILTLYDPSSTTYVKHFTSTIETMHGGNYAQNSFAAGYINTGDPTDQPAITEINFKFSSGSIDAGIIHMYGVG